MFSAKFRRTSFTRGRKFQIRQAEPIAIGSNHWHELRCSESKARIAADDALRIASEKLPRREDPRLVALCTWYQRRRNSDVVLIQAHTEATHFFFGWQENASVKPMIFA